MSANHQVWSDDSSATSGCVLEWPPPYDGDHSHPGSATQRQILRCPAAHGVDGSRSANEVLYLPPRSNEDVWGNVVLFPGDVQDLHHRMLSKGHREFSDYCLESTAQALATKFPGHAVWVVLPKTLVHGALASYDNFGKTDWESGGAIPEYVVDGSACKHLEAILNAAADAVQSLRRSGACGAIADCRPDMSLPLTLVGFSKGAVVLNQLVTELASGAEPTAASIPTPSRGSKRSDSRDEGHPVRLKKNRKRSRVSTSTSIRYNGSECDGGGRLASSEGVLTNPPSPADDSGSTASGSWPMAWEGQRGDRDTLTRNSRGGGLQDGSRLNQENTGSLWSRLWSTLSMSRFSTRPFSLTSVGLSTNGSRTDEDLDRASGGGWKATKNADEDQEDLPNPGSPSRRPATARDPRRSSRRPTCTSAFVAKEDDDARNTDRRPHGQSAGGAAQRLFDRVAAIHWVDGGNGDLAGGSFPTNMCSLARLAALPNLAIRVHGTPYQWGNHCRPFLAFEADTFVASVEGFRRALHARGRYGFAAANSTNSGVVAAALRGRECPTGATSDMAEDVDGNTVIDGPEEAETESTGSGGSSKGGDRVGAGCDVKRLVYFESEQPSLENHFRVLTELSTE